MARGAGYTALEAQCRKIVEDAKAGVFAPVYLLMGEEAYYPDMVCQAIIDNALEEEERDFNQTICYGMDVDADTVITAARRYPMMAERQLVVVKEAQNMKSLDQLSLYCDNPLDSTVLVILLHGAKYDKRKSLYLSVKKHGVIVESPLLKDYEVADWISSWYSGRGLQIDPDAAALLAEDAGADLGKIAVETEKLLKNLPEGTVRVTAADIEKNVGISRMFSIFELTKALSLHKAPEALRLASHIGNAPKFALPAATSALFLHFNRILRYHALLQKNPRPSNAEKAAVLAVNPYFFREYDSAISFYPLQKCLRIISLLNEYDYRGKGGDTGEATGADLLMELVTKILNL